MASRRLLAARWLHIFLLLSIGAGIALGALLQTDWIGLLALLAAIIWILLIARSARTVRRVREAWSAVQLGRTELGRARAQEALAMWSMLRPATLGAVQVLALAAQRAGQHAEAAQLSSFVLSRPERLLVGDRTGMQLLLVESLVALDQLGAAHAASLPLYSTKLQLAEALRLLGLQLRLEARWGAHASTVQNISAKVDMAELMPPAESAIAQALLGLAAEQQGLADWAAWLWRRVNLLADFPVLQQSEPMLRGLGAKFAPPPPAPTDNSSPRHSELPAAAG